MSIASASKQNSKKSKYEDVDCVHFKNGGKCVHCIKKWKAEQSKISSTEVWLIYVTLCNLQFL